MYTSDKSTVLAVEETFFQSSICFSWLRRRPAAVKKLVPRRYPQTPKILLPNLSYTSKLILEPTKLPIASWLLEIRYMKEINSLSDLVQEGDLVGLLGNFKKGLKVHPASFIVEIGNGKELNSIQHIKEGRFDLILTEQWNMQLLWNIARSRIPVTCQVNSECQLGELVLGWEKVLKSTLQNKDLNVKSFAKKLSLQITAAKQGYWVTINTYSTNFQTCLMDLFSQVHQDKDLLARKLNDKLYSCMFVELKENQNRLQRQLTKAQKMHFLLSNQIITYQDLHPVTDSSQPSSPIVESVFDQDFEIFSREIKQRLFGAQQDSKGLEELSEDSDFCLHKADPYEGIQGDDQRSIQCGSSASYKLMRFRSKTFSGHWQSEKEDCSKTDTSSVQEYF